MQTMRDCICGSVRQVKSSFCNQRKPLCPPSFFFACMQWWLHTSPFIMQAKLSHLSPYGLHCCEKVTASRQREAGKRRGQPNVIRTSYRSTQTKRYSCNFGAAVQQSAGNVGGFNKKWVSLCAQLDFLLCTLAALHRISWCIDNM